MNAVVAGAVNDAAIASEDAARNVREDEQAAADFVRQLSPMPENIAKCDECGRERSHCIVRLNREGRPRLCNECHGRTKP